MRVGPSSPKWDVETLYILLPALSSSLGLSSLCHDALEHIVPEKSRHVEQTYLEDQK